MTTTSNGTGDILDILQLAKNRYPGNREMQGKYLNIAIDLMKRDYEEIQSIDLEWNDFDVELTVFPNLGMVYSFWELNQNGETKAVGLEEMNPDSRISRLLFSSDTRYTTSLVNMWM